MRRVWVALLFVFCLGGGALAGDAAAPLAHAVQAGETFESIAELYGLSPEALRQANPGLETLEAGLLVSLPSPPAGWPAHTVEPGQTLWSISKRYGVTVEQLRVVNRISDDRLLAWQRLEVPCSPDRAAAAAASPWAPATTDVEVPPAPPVTGWLEVRLPDGSRAWAPATTMLIPSSRPLPPDELVSLARRFAGTPYRWGGTSPNGVDCSGYVQEVFRLGGHTLRRTADLQYADTVEVPRESMQPGDLVFFSTYEPGPSHVGICTGPGRFLHASSSRGVVESGLDEDYFARRFLGVRRLPAWNGPATVGEGVIP
ncbi:MAG: NlpC/P60 family protein [Candidatus Eremiobacterota bacterium]